MRLFLSCLCGIALLALASCEKDLPLPVPPTQHYELYVANEYNELQAHYAVYLSDSDGKIRVYRDLVGNDTAKVVVSDAKVTDRFDCTVVKITTLQTNGLRDTTITLSTYTNLGSGEQINLRDLTYRQNIDLKIQFTGVTSVDSIIVADGLTFTRPQPGNSFNGFYRVQHTGKLWLRVLVNGEDHWRFLYFDNVSGPTLETTVDVALLPVILAKPTNIAFPFSAPWQYKVEGLVDSTKNQFLPLGDLQRAPGGAVPVFAQLDVFQPVDNEEFNPAGLPYTAYRMNIRGFDGSPTGYTYVLDKLFATLPVALPLPDFDLQPTVAPNGRFMAVQCVGSFDVLAFSRSRSGTPNITWEVYTRPAVPNSNGLVSYRLPDVPADLGNRFPVLKNYNFNGPTSARAESYEKLTDYNAIIRLRLGNNDPIWQMKGGYIGREEGL